MNMNKKFGKIANLLVSNLFSFEVFSHGEYVNVTLPLEGCELRFQISDGDEVKIIEKYPGSQEDVRFGIDWSIFPDKLASYLDYLIWVDNNPEFNSSDAAPLSDWYSLSRARWSSEESINLDSAYFKSKERIESEYSERAVNQSLLEEIENKFNEYLEKYRSEIRITSCDWNPRTNTITFNVRM